MQWMDRGADVAAAAIPARIGARLNMDTQRWERIGDVFERLLGVSQVQRPHLLDSLCGEDAEMKRIVASMLESEDSAQRSDQASAPSPLRPNVDREAMEQIDAALVGTRIGP
jgi:hypothetical protein